MPIYEYRRPDGTTFEVQQAFTDEPLTRDPDTGAPVARVLHAPAVHFKGTGFYNTDYGTRKRQRELASSADGSSGDGKEPSAGASSSDQGKDGASRAATDGAAKDKGAGQNAAKASEKAKPPKSAPANG
jgi:putative FmdB family regulatory protein